MQCNNCQKDITGNAPQIECTDCGSQFHQYCTDANKTRSGKTIAQWKCQQCRPKAQTPVNDMDKLIGMVQNIEMQMGKFDSIEKQIDNLKQFMKQEINAVKKELSDRIEIVEEKQEENEKEAHYTLRRLNELEQRSRLDNIEITNFPVSTNEDPTTIIIQISKAIGFELNPQQILACHRVPTRAVGKPPNIIAQLENRKLREDFLQKYKAYAKNHNYKKPCANDIANGLPTTRFYINEHLTVHNKKLFAETKEKARQLGYKYIWISNCKINVRQNERSKIIIIASAQDLSRLAHHHQNATSM